MADIYLHYKLAAELLSHESYPFDASAFLIGSQGPDPFYYAVLGSNRTRSRTIGDRLHDTRINYFFAAAIDYLQQHPSPFMDAYFAGFLCHFALDLHLHPYVYHHAGIYDSTKPQTAALRGLHLKFERAIDARLMAEETHQPAYRYPLAKTLPLKRIPLELQAFYDHVVHATLEHNSGGALFSEGYTMMRRIVRFVMRDRLGIKRRIYQLLDRFNRDADLFFADMSFRNVKTSFDVLNRQHAVWYHPVTNTPSLKSVDDLYLDAYADAKMYIEKIGPVLKTGQPLSIQALFGNRSFNSGLDCDDARPMQHFQPFTQKRG